MADLIIHRANNTIPNIEVTVGKDDVIFAGEVMGMNKITFSFSHDQPLEFYINDFIVHNGHGYRLREPAQAIMNADFNYDYSGEFLGREYSLNGTLVKQNGNLTFPFFATAAEHLKLIIDTANSNVLDAGWSAGSVAVSDPISINYDKDSCWSALAKIAEAFGFEYGFRFQEIDLKKEIGSVVHDLTFSYGIHKGLYSMTKKASSNGEFGTRFYGFGSTENLPPGYRNGLTQLSFDPGFIDRNIDKYGGIPIERPIVFENIRPERTGVISSVGTELEFSDTSLDFDLNSVMVDGKAEVSFVTGLLAGQSFEIRDYTHATHLFRIFANETENGDVTPNPTIKPAAGDRYTLLGIQLPAPYVTAAEDRVRLATIAHAEINSDPTLEFALTIDPIFMMELNYEYVLNPGDRIRALQPSMNIDAILRITAISYPVFNPFKITTTIGTKVTASLGQEIIKGVESNKEEITQGRRSQINEARRNIVNLRALAGKVFDPTGDYFDMDNIRNGSIETLFLSVGAKATNFVLNETTFNTNYQGDPNRIRVSAGKLIHYDVEVPGVGFTWEMPAYFNDALSASTSYNIYARVSRTSLVGEWVLSPDIIHVEDQLGYWNFQAGVLFPVTAGRRDHQITSGMVFMIGDQITAGILKDLSGINFFNMTNGTFNLGAVGTGLDFGISVANALSVDQIIIGYGDYVSGIGNQGEYPLFIGANALNNPISAKFRVQRDGTFFATGANISGVLNAGAGSTIGDILIDAAGKFNLVGTKVELLPDVRLKVFNDGEVDFSGAAKMTVPTKTPENLLAGQSAFWIGNLSGLENIPGGYVLPPATTTTLGGIIVGSGLSVDSFGKLNSTGGESPLTFGFPLIRTLNNVTLQEGATLNNNISGTAVAATYAERWGNGLADFTTFGTSIQAFAAFDGPTGKTKHFGVPETKYTLGIDNGSTLANNISGTAAAATYATYWGGRTANFDATTTDILRMVAVDNATGQIRQVNKEPTQSWLGLGSFAYRNAIDGNEVGTYIAFKVADIGVSQMLRWKNYGDSHVIFDASNGTSPGGTVVDNSNSQNVWQATFPTLMGWNGSQTYGVRVDAARQADGSHQWNGLARTAEGITVPGYVMTMNTDGSNAGYTSKGNLQNWLNVTQGGETLQSVTDRYNYTSLALRSPNFTAETATSNWSVKASGAENSMSIVDNQFGTTYAYLKSGNFNIGYSTDQGFRLAVNGSFKAVSAYGNILIDNVGSGNNYYYATTAHTFQGGPVIAEGNVISPKFTSTNEGFKSNNFRGLVGDYNENSSSDKIIWTIGDNWNTIEAMYGLGYQYNTKYGAAHSIVFRQAGLVTAAIDLGGGSMYLDGNLTATRATAVVVKATGALSVPTIAPTVVNAGEAYFWIGNLSGISN